MVKKHYTIDYAEGVEEDLAELRAYDQARILDKIDEQLIYAPARETRNKKMLVGLVPPWDYIEPAWELRVGEYRVFYDVDEKTLTVTIRAIRFKPPDKTTEDILW
jgi:mRNA-degrading endonuclease RelE of RelBE toxin-antitoxin system